MTGCFLRGKCPVIRLFCEIMNFAAAVHAGKPADAAVDGLLQSLCDPNVRFKPDVLHGQNTASAVSRGFQPSDEAVTVEEGQNIIGASASQRARNVFSEQTSSRMGTAAVGL